MDHNYCPTPGWGLWQHQQELTPPHTHTLPRSSAVTPRPATAISPLVSTVFLFFWLFFFNEYYFLNCIYFKIKFLGPWPGFLVEALSGAQKVVGSIPGYGMYPRFRINPWYAAYQRKPIDWCFFLTSLSLLPSLYLSLLPLFPPSLPQINKYIL